jgi:hypothetical protein
MPLMYRPAEGGNSASDTGFELILFSHEDPAGGLESSLLVAPISHRSNLIASEQIPNDF